MGLCVIGFKVGMIINCDCEFFEYEVKVVEVGIWVNLFDVMVCGDDIFNCKFYLD